MAHLAHLGGEWVSLAESWGMLLWHWVGSSDDPIHCSLCLAKERRADGQSTAARHVVCSFLKLPVLFLLIVHLFTCIESLG